MANNPDLVIRGGSIADGLGGELFEADVAVSDGRIVEVGRVLSKGTEEIDARGKLIAPGFVDVHTHYDGQVTWSQASRHRRRTASRQRSWAIAGWASHPVVRQIISG